MNAESIILGASTKLVVEPVVKSIVGMAQSLSKDFKECFIMEGQKLSILCPENAQKHTIFFKIKKNILISGFKILKGNARKVTLMTISAPIEDITHKAIRRLDGGFEINYKELSEDTLYWLEVEYDLETKGILDKIVRRSVSREPSNADIGYWMQAGLKNLDIFKTEYKNIELKDLDFFVDLAVYNDIKTKIPVYFQNQLKVAVGLIESRDRNEKINLAYEDLKLKSAQPSKQDIRLVLNELQNVFSPDKFKKFINVDKDFKYFQSFRGEDFYNATFPTWPRFMKVVCRTDLSYDNPASEGKLIYKSGDFREDVGKIFNMNK
ncbi:hypothetical protein [Methanococcus maripaludis]|uniref:Uncharacterized protein n=1 Tax=Methanococcus maripaludis OS7 TaxID=637915 RepID=A0A2Z5PIA2_METMI|nr:hypothetical protein [Methanococcus maripaludis]BAP62563.1 hypothetical protein MMOS7_04770 [Methanococcus maripaludis OS7]